MQHIRQQPNECLVTSLAMVLDKPVATIREHIAKHWFARARWKAADKLVPFAEQSFDTFLRSDASNTGRSPALVRSRLHGTGILSIWWNEGPGHTVAFDNSIIYDGELNGPIPYREWRERFRHITHWRIQRRKT